jgi:hypothetical protein
MHGWSKCSLWLHFSAIHAVIFQFSNKLFEAAELHFILEEIRLLPRNCGATSLQSIKYP